MRFTNRLVPGILAGSLLFGGATGVLAASAHKVHRTLAYGQVSGVSSTGFTLTALSASGTALASQPIAVAVSPTTKQKALKGTTGTLVDKDYALVVGTTTASGVTATRVVYSSTPFKAARLLRQHRVIGTVDTVASTATTLVITTKKGKTLSFDITGTTKYRVAGKVATIAPSFSQGEKVVVLFKRDKATKHLIALAIGVRSASPA